MLKDAYNTNDNDTNKKKNTELVDSIKSGLKDLENEIEQMSKNEGENERPNKIVDIVERILYFSNQNQEV